MLSLRGLTARGLAPFDFHLEAGECVAVTGASGSGKSLLLRAIADLDPNDGQALLDGTPRAAIAGPDWRQRVGYLAPVAGWWAETVGAHFADAEAARGLVRAVGLDAKAFGWSVSRLSTGEAQRLALARLLAGAPEVLLLDEPTGALDAAARRAVEAILKERLAAGAAILLVTHDRAQARRLAKRALRIAKGRVREGAP